MNPYREPVKGIPWYVPGTKERWRKRRGWVRVFCLHDVKFVSGSICWACYRCQKCHHLDVRYIPSKA